MAEASPAQSEQDSLARADALADLESWRERLAKAPEHPEKVFGNQLELDAARAMKWRVAAHWIAEKPRERQLVARGAVKALRLEAIRSADSGDQMQAFRDLSFALRILIECEPRDSLDSWVSWLNLERDVIEEVEDVSSRYELADAHVQWYENALARSPSATPRKLAGLILTESQGVESLVEGLDMSRLLPSSQEEGVGRRFLSVLKSAGNVVSVAELAREASVCRSIGKRRHL